MAPLTVAERHRIWLRLCQIAASSIPTVQAAQVPSDAIPLDARDAPPQSAADFIAAIPAADLPADPAQAQEIRDLLAYLQRVISLHKFDVSTVDPEKHGYFRIDTRDAEPYWESQRRLSHHEQELLHERIKEYDAADITEPGTGPWASNPLFVSKKDGGSCSPSLTLLPSMHWTQVYSWVSALAVWLQFLHTTLSCHASGSLFQHFCSAETTSRAIP